MPDQIVRRGPFRAVLARIPGKATPAGRPRPPGTPAGGWTYVKVPKRLAPPITRAWGRTPVRAELDGRPWTTSLWRSKDGSGFLPIPKRVRGTKEEGTRVSVAFEFDDD